MIGVQYSRVGIRFFADLGFLTGGFLPEKSFVFDWAVFYCLPVIQEGGSADDHSNPYSHKDYAEEYLNYSKANRAKRGYERDQTSINVHLNPHFGGHYLASITTKMVQDYKTKRKGEANVATANRELCCLSNMFRKAIDWGYLKRSPSKGVKLFKETPKEARWLDKEEIGRLLKKCPRHIYVLVATALNTGLRRMELFHLEWSDVDFKSETITVRSKDDWHTKNYEFRTIPINSFLYGILPDTSTASTSFPTPKASLGITSGLAFQTPLHGLV